MKSRNESVYLRIYEWTYSSARRAKTLRILDVSLVALTVLAYAFALIYTGIRDGAIWTPLKMVFVTGAPFVLVSLLRGALDMPRPRDVFKLDFLPSKRLGNSFPSRHVFSAFSIGAALCFVIAPLGVAVLALGVAVASCRVLLGNHFLRDVIAGALIGIGCSVIGMLIL